MSSLGPSEIEGPANLPSTASRRSPPPVRPLWDVRRGCEAAHPRRRFPACATQPASPGANAPRDRRSCHRGRSNRPSADRTTTRLASSPSPSRGHEVLCRLDVFRRRLGKGGAVDLAVGRERHALQANEVRRHMDSNSSSARWARKSATGSRFERRSRPRVVRCHLRPQPARHSRSRP